MCIAYLLFTIHHKTKRNDADKQRMGLSSRRITSIVQSVIVIGQKRSVAWCTQKWLRYLKWRTAKFKRSAGQEYTKKDCLAYPLLFDDLRKKLVHIMKLRETQRNREKREVTMVAKFLDLNYCSWHRRSFALTNDRRKLWATVLFLSAIRKSESHTCHVVFSAILAGPGRFFFEIQKGCYHSSVT